MDDAWSIRKKSRIALSRLSLMLGLACLTANAFAQAVKPGQLFGYSLLEIRAPDSNGWQISGGDRSTITFGRRGTSSNETFIAHASEFRLPPTKDAEEFLAFVKNSVEKESEPERFKPIETTFEYTEERGYECVRFKSVAQDTQARTGLLSRESLTIRSSSIYCRNPRRSTVGFVASFTHRGPTPYAPFDSEAEAFIRGVKVPAQNPAEELIDRADLALKNNLFADAERLYQQAIEAYEKQGNRERVAYAQARYGLMFVSPDYLKSQNKASGDTDQTQFRLQALQRLDIAIQIFTNLDNPAGRSFALFQSGNVLSSLRRVEAACQAYDDADRYRSEALRRDPKANFVMLAGFKNWAEVTAHYKKQAGCP